MYLKGEIGTVGEATGFVRAQCLAQAGTLWDLNKGMNKGRLGIGEERGLISCRSEAPVCTS